MQHNISKLIFKLTSTTELWLSRLRLPAANGLPSIYKHFLPSQAIKKSPVLRKRTVACLLDIFQAGPSSFKSTSTC